MSKFHKTQFSVFFGTKLPANQLKKSITKFLLFHQKVACVFYPFLWPETFGQNLVIVQKEIPSQYEREVLFTKVLLEVVIYTLGKYDPLRNLGSGDG